MMDWELPAKSPKEIFFENSRAQFSQLHRRHTTPKLVVVSVIGSRPVAAQVSIQKSRFS